MNTTSQPPTADPTRSATKAVRPAAGPAPRASGPAHPASGPAHPASGAAPSRPTASECGWNQRAFVVVGAALSGLALPVTGIIDHAAGHSTQQAQVGWAIVHGALGGLFVGFCTWHILLNRRALLRYLRGRGAAQGAPAKEIVAAAALVGVVLLVTVSHALVEG